MAKKSNTKRTDARIAVQIYLGTLDGKRQYKTVYGKTQKEANEKAQQVKLQLKKGLDINAQNDTFGQWASRWLEMKKADISHSQYLSYVSALKHYSSIYYISISKITISDVQSIINRLALENPNTRKPTAKKTLIEIRSTANQIFKMAIQNRVIDYNPIEAVTIPKKAPQAHRRALTNEEQQWIIDTPHRAQTAAMIMMFAGLRRGEVIPLTWNDIDLKNSTISVNKYVEFINGQPKVKMSTKTDAGIRTIDIPQILVQFLIEKRKP